MTAQFDLIAPAMIIGVVLVATGYGLYRLTLKVRSFLRASWRNIPYGPNRHAVGRDAYREFRK